MYDNIKLSPMRSSTGLLVFSSTSPTPLVIKIGTVPVGAAGGAAIIFSKIDCTWTTVGSGSDTHAAHTA